MTNGEEIARMKEEIRRSEDRLKEAEGLLDYIKTLLTTGADGAIVDTVWYNDMVTLYDQIDAFLEQDDAPC